MQIFNIGNKLQLQEKLADSDSERKAMEVEILSMKDKLERARLDNLQENEDVLTELRVLHDKEKTLLMDENQKLSSELEKAVAVIGFHCTWKNFFWQGL